MTAKKLQHFESLLSGTTTLDMISPPQQLLPTTAGMTPGKQNSNNNTPHHWSIGMNLQSIVETDNETDRNSYASSERSSSLPRTPGTPNTPSIRALKLRYVQYNSVNVWFISQ